MERYLAAAQGTGVGIIANLTSFFDSAMLAIGMTDSLYMFYDNRPLLDKLMDILVEHQEKVMRAVCEQYGDEIAFVMINDDIGHNAGLMVHPRMFMEMFPERMKRLIAPAKEIGKLVLMHTDGKLDNILPILYEVGIDINHPIEPESNDIVEVKRKWQGKNGLDRQCPYAFAGLWQYRGNRESSSGILPKIGSRRRLCAGVFDQYHGWHSPAKFCCDG